MFKMEDVSMGMWVEQFNSSKPVVYVHSLKFCQFGCIEDYYTAHYQSPRQIMCMWTKLQLQGRPQCCNMRWVWLWCDLSSSESSIERERNKYKFCSQHNVIVYSVEVPYKWQISIQILSFFLYPCFGFRSPFPPSSEGLKFEGNEIRWGGNKVKRIKVLLYTH